MTCVRRYEIHVGVNRPEVIQFFHKESQWMKCKGKGNSWQDIRLIEYFFHWDRVKL
jgi:hypothetical protein